jgi:S-methyl-5-thioribose-1-phosphate isomerase
VRTIDWTENAIQIIDQTALPNDVRVLTLDTIDALVDAIGRLAIRGAPALGAAGALGVALSVVLFDGDQDRVRSAASLIRDARPTAVNLAWGVDRALGVLDNGVAAVVAEALAVLSEDALTNRRIGRRGAELITELGLHQVSALTHCNTGALACVEWGTALGILRQLQEDGRLRHVIATETRPLLQGARLTTWELAEIGVEHHLIVDSAAAWALTNHLADLVVVGADRIAANGDVANKIGTLAIALAAADAGVPFIVAAPESTIDQNTPQGGSIVIEYRNDDEVTSWRGISTAPAGTPALNPAFDVTPARLITAIVTESRVFRPAETAPAGTRSRSVEGRQSPTA